MESSILRRLHVRRWRGWPARDHLVSSSGGVPSRREFRLAVPDGEAGRAGQGKPAQLAPDQSRSPWLPASERLVPSRSRLTVSAGVRCVAELMEHNVITCTPDDPVQQVMAEMTRRRVRHLPVIEVETLNRR
jgi:CBS domain-containing protein